MCVVKAAAFLGKNCELEISAQILIVLALLDPDSPSAQEIIEGPRLQPINYTLERLDVLFLLIIRVRDAENV